MPISYKLAIVFIVVGLLNFLLRRNRNWIFGYRSPRAIKTHNSFAYANKIYGLGMSIFGVLYLGMLIYDDEYVSLNLPSWSDWVINLSYFALLFALIEIMLKRAFPN